MTQAAPEGGDCRFDTYLAPFVRKGGLGYEAVPRGHAGVISNRNVRSRWGTQTPFTDLATGAGPGVGGRRVALCASGRG